MVAAAWHDVSMPVVCMPTVVVVTTGKQFAEKAVGKVTVAEALAFTDGVLPHCISVPLGSLV